MIGTKIYKPVTDWTEHGKCANWCNDNQQGMIVDRGDFYECVPIPEPSQEELLEKEKMELEQWLLAGI